MALSGVKVETVQISGLNETLRVLKAIGGKEMTVAIRKAGIQAAEAVVSDARTEVPVRTGRLRESIGIRALQRAVYIKSGNNRLVYSNPIHWGWVRRHIKPNPFLARALGYNRDEIARRYDEQLKKLVRDAVTKYGHKAGAK